MHPNLFFVTVMIVIFSCVRTSLGATDAQYTNCSTLLSCANLQNIGYPFWGGSRPSYCGYGHGAFELKCSSDAPQITIQSIPYRVLQITAATPTPTLVVARADLWTNPCPATGTTLRNTTLDATNFTYATGTQDLFLYYGCIYQSTVMPPLPNNFTCVSNGNIQSFGIYSNISISSLSVVYLCPTNVTVRVEQTAAQALAGNGGNHLAQVLDTGFGLTWQANNSACALCAGSGGQCGSNSSSPFVCYCSDGPSSAFTCQTSSTGNSSKKPIVGSIVPPIAGAVLAGVGVGWALFSYRQRRSKRKAADAGSQDATTPLSKEISSTSRTKSNPSFPSSNSEYGKVSTYFGVQVFSYTELEEATNNFDPSTQLGEGGFGTVYYGTLKDGRVVAVKRLFENNFKRVEQFMNEVEILTRLRHENLVTLFGCTSKRSRELLLVYEYISNGTLADHLHGKLKNSGLLTWSFRLNIAIETADALAYLHASEIIHRDVKTNNILLESDFHVKVADFGLSRLFPTDVTHVSTAPQGTPGYVDPEYYQCYQLTEKSDVYSFGVVLIELISSKQAVDTNRHRQEINLATMAINKIQNHTLHELVDPSLEFETNSSVRRMATLVAELAFRCLQMEKDMRPSMKEVLAALKGIKNEEPNAQAEEVDIVIEDGVGLSKDNPPPMSPDSTATEKITNSTTSNSGG